MITLRRVPLFGASTRGKSDAVTVQRRLNCYFENRPDGDKTSIACYGTPGLALKFNLTTTSSQPVRGWVGTQSALYLVAYNQFQSVNITTGVAAFTGAVTTVAGNCSLAVNSGITQIMVVDGTSGYLYTPGAATFAAIAASFPNGAKTCTFVSNFGVAEKPGTQQFYVSSANDLSTWPALSFGSASAYADNILAVDNLAGILLTFSQQHTEFWQATGANPFPFAPILSAANEYGLAAIFSRGHVDQSLIFLAQNREGQKQVVRIQGYNATVISDSDIDSLINDLTTTSDATCLVYGKDTHKFYQLNFPSEGRSLLFDCATGLWSEVQTGISVVPARHNGNFSAYVGGITYVSDYANSNVYTFSASTYTDNGTTIAREIITRHQLSSFNRIRISTLYLDMETGIGLQSGQGSNPQVMLEYSKDNGRTWSSERWAGVGMVGQYIARVIFRRFGSTRDATFRLRMTDPVKFVITEAAMKIRAQKTVLQPGRAA